MENIYDVSQDDPRTDRRRLAHHCRCSARFRRRLLPRPSSWGHGLGYGWGPAIGVGFGGVYVDTGLNGCLQQRWVETRRGMRLRTVNVCAY